MNHRNDEQVMLIRLDLIRQNEWRVLHLYSSNLYYVHEKVVYLSLNENTQEKEPVRGGCRARLQSGLSIFWIGPQIVNLRPQTENHVNFLEINFSCFWLRFIVSKLLYHADPQADRSARLQGGIV